MKMGIVVAVCGAIGLVTVVATISATLPGIKATPHVGAGTPVRATEEYGRHLIAQTTEVLGPDVPDAKMRSMNSRLACASCHIGAGAEQGNLSLVAAMSKYPRNSPRVGGNETIQMRINGCMTRSMNGRALKEDSPEMAAMVSYVRYLSDQDAETGAAQKKVHEPPAFKTPNRKADLESGRRVFQNKCAPCHGKDGAGLQASTKPVDGYVFPPLWGGNSFNEGAGMYIVSSPPPSSSKPKCLSASPNSTTTIPLT